MAQLHSSNYHLTCWEWHFKASETKGMTTQKSTNNCGLDIIHIACTPSYDRQARSPILNLHFHVRATKLASSINLETEWLIIECHRFVQSRTTAGSAAHLILSAGDFQVLLSTIAAQGGVTWSLVCSIIPHNYALESLMWSNRTSERTRFTFPE